MDQKSKLTKLKKQRDKVDKTCQELKQDTGIVSNSSMKEDHEKRELQNKELVELIYQKKSTTRCLKTRSNLRVSTKHSSLETIWTREILNLLYNSQAL
jgi:hypothetical protein